MIDRVIAIFFAQVFIDARSLVTNKTCGVADGTKVSGKGPRADDIISESPGGIENRQNCVSDMDGDVPGHMMRVEYK